MAASSLCLLLLPPPKDPLPSISAITILTAPTLIGSIRNLRLSSYHLCTRNRHIHHHQLMMGRAPRCSNKVDEAADIESSLLDCVGTGTDVECVVKEDSSNSDVSDVSLSVLDWLLLISPFFFWGTSMVAMKQVLPKTGPFFVAAVRLIPAGAILVSFAFSRGRPLPSSLIAWLSIAVFGLVDATCFQGFLAQGLLRTSAGLGSVIIDSQPLTVAVLAALLFGESLGLVGITGLVLGVVGLLLLEVPTISLDKDFSIVGSGELWMLLAAQSMAVGTVMVRWVSKYSDPVMATGWHMIIGGVPIVLISVLNHEPVLQGNLSELSTNDLIALAYTSIFGSAVSYGLYFYNANRGSLTKLSSLTFLTPMFASMFGAGMDIWRAEVPLICFHIAEWHYPSRVMRQFGLGQPVPLAPRNNHKEMHKHIRRHVQVVAEEMHNWIGIWDDRAARVYTSEPDPDGALIPAYYAWYWSVTRRRIQPPLSTLDPYRPSGPEHYAFVAS